jgi:protein gp37
VALRFLSIEPLLEDLGDFDLSSIHWVIVGGESGRGARPMEEAWVERLLRQCTEAEVAFFFKQWGGVHKAKTGRTLHGKTFDGMPERKVAPFPSRKDRLSRSHAWRQVAARWTLEQQLVQLPVAACS